MQTHAALCRATYARVDPAVIVIATCGAQILLGRNIKWPEGRYSALAGFVEIGESLEEAACREVFEESNVKVRHMHHVWGCLYPQLDPFNYMMRSRFERLPMHAPC